MITLMCSSGSVVSHHPLFIVYFSHQFCVEAHAPLYATVIPAGSTYQQRDSNARGSGSHGMTGSQHNGGTAMGSCTTCGSPMAVTPAVVLLVVATRWWHQQQHNSGTGNSNVETA